MIFVDTNYFLRFLLQDNQEQYKEAKELFLKAARTEENLITSTLVFFEVAWVLRSNPKINKEILVEKLFKLASLNIDIEHREILIEAIGMFRENNLTLEDCYNLVYAKNKKVKEFKTFDKKLRKIYNSHHFSG